MKRGSTAIVVGIIGSFDLNIIGALMFSLIERFEFLKWNPLNFLYYPQQATRTGIYSELTHLSNNELLIGNISYIALFLALGLFLFSKKEV